MHPALKSTHPLILSGKTEGNSPHIGYNRLETVVTKMDTEGRAMVFDIVITQPNFQPNFNPTQSNFNPALGYLAIGLHTTHLPTLKLLTNFHAT